MQKIEIEAFLAIVRNGSLSKAADQLFITQPALSHRLSMLEDELGVVLFSRSRGQRAVEITEAGKQFISLAEKWLSLMDECNELKKIPDRPIFNIAATQTLSNYTMPAVYSRFLQRNLPVTLNLSTLHFGEAYLAIENHSVHAVFTSRIIPSSRVSTIPVASESMVLLSNSAFPAHDDFPIEELNPNQGISMRWTPEFFLWQNYWFGSDAFRIRADNMRLTEELMLEHPMWAIVPLSAARAAIKNPRLQYHSLRNAPPQRPIYLLTLEPQYPLTRYLVEDLQSILQEG